MIVLVIVICLAFILSAVLRFCGAARWLAMALPVLPALAAFVYFASRPDIEFGPHGGIVPAWTVAGIILLVVFGCSFFATVLASGKKSR